MYTSSQSRHRLPTYPYNISAFVGYTIGCLSHALLPFVHQWKMDGLLALSASLQGSGTTDFGRNVGRPGGGWGGTNGKQTLIRMFSKLQHNRLWQKYWQARGRTGRHEQKMDYYLSVVKAMAQLIMAEMLVGQRQDREGCQ